MRIAFVEKIKKLMDENVKICLLTCDMGIILFDSIREKHPKRFINLGLCEGNMMGVASGMALTGKIPFVYTIASFATQRCFEQIKVDVCYQQANVKIIGIGAGISYSISGSTHHTISEISMLRALPNMTIVSPADQIEAEVMTETVLHHKGPTYMRLGIEGGPRIHQEKINIDIGKSVTLQSGDDVTLLSYGSLVHSTLEAAKILSKKGISARVINIYSLKPVDKLAVLKAAHQTNVIVTVEDHNIFGGLGSIIAEILCEEGINVKFKRLGMPDTFCSEYGSYSFLLKKYGLSPDLISKQVLKLLRS